MLRTACLLGQRHRPRSATEALLPRRRGPPSYEHGPGRRLTPPAPTRCGSTAPARGEFQHPSPASVAAFAGQAGLAQAHRLAGVRQLKLPGAEERLASQRGAGPITCLPRARQPDKDLIIASTGIDGGCRRCRAIEQAAMPRLHQARRPPVLPRSGSRRTLRRRGRAPGTPTPARPSLSTTETPPGVLRPRAGWLIARVVWRHKWPRRM